MEAVGKDVTLFKVGDKVCPVFPQGHHWVGLPLLPASTREVHALQLTLQEEDMKLRSLKRGLGGAIDGVAQEYFVCDEEEAVMMPSNFDYRDGSTLSVSRLYARAGLQLMF